MASSFSKGERVRLFTLSLPESFQFFSVGACSHWLVLLDGSTGDVFASGLSWSPMSDMGVRRAKAALSSGCKAHPANAPAGSNRSSHGGNEVAEAFG